MKTEPQNVGKLLEENEYPGRGIIIGLSGDGEQAVFAYFIMGRSENSRNRIFTATKDGIRTQAFDESKMTDPSLIIYSPVRRFENKIIVTNGDQTDTIYDFLAKGESFEAALQTREFEPDEPNFTPRISGILDFEAGYSYKLGIIKRGSQGEAVREYFHYAPEKGNGHMIHTYEKDGNPLPSFSGEPRAVAVSGEIDEFTELLWGSLNNSNKVSLYVRYIDLKSGAAIERIMNKHK